MAKLRKDPRRATMMAAHQHYRRMADRHPDWPFASSLRIELNRARSVGAIMREIAEAVTAHLNREDRE